MPSLEIFALYGADEKPGGITGKSGVVLGEEPVENFKLRPDAFRRVGGD